MSLELRKIQKTDLELLRDWRNLEEIRQFNTQYTLLNMKNQENWFDELQKERPDRHMFIINYKKKPIGVCGLIHHDKLNHSADIAIIIGDKEFHSRGLGTITLQKLIRLGFEKLKLHRIGAEVFEYNQESEKLFTKLNFKKEVILKHALWRKGKWWNIHVLSLINSD